MSENKNLEWWDGWKQPPSTALKEFNNGSFKGTDISPVWRLQALTEKFGPCGIGWYYTIDKLWTEQGFNSVVMCFANVSLYVAIQPVANGNDVQTRWSAPICGNGGNEIIHHFKTGPKNSDDGYKMAITDALGSACKNLGIGANIYAGQDESKYQKQDNQNKNNSNNQKAKQDRELMSAQSYLESTASKYGFFSSGSTPQDLVTLALKFGTIDKVKSIYDFTVKECNDLRLAIEKHMKNQQGKNNG